MHDWGRYDWSSYILRRPQNFEKSQPIIWLAVHWTKVGINHLPYIGQIIVGDFENFCGLLRIYERNCWTNQKHSIRKLYIFNKGQQKLKWFWEDIVSSKTQRNSYYNFVGFWEKRCLHKIISVFTKFGFHWPLEAGMIKYFQMKIDHISKRKELKNAQGELWFNFGQYYRSDITMYDFIHIIQFLNPYFELDFQKDARKCDFFHFSFGIWQRLHSYLNLL